MATPRKPVRHGRVRPAPEPLPVPAPPASAPTNNDAGATSLEIPVIYEPLAALAEIEVLLTYEDPANGFTEHRTLRLRAADGAQQRSFSLQPPDPKRRQHRWSIRGVTGDGVVFEGPTTASDAPRITIDAALQAALLRKYT